MVRSLPIVNLLFGPDGLREIFEVHLVADAGAGRHDAEIVEGASGPISGTVALAVALVFEVDVGERLRRAEFVDDDRMVDDEIDGHERVDLLRDRRSSAVIASRIAARSTTAGTPVKSCISTRAGRKAISRSVLPRFFSHSATP